MAWLAISGTFVQYHKLGDTFATDRYIKFYAAGTNTPINMATSSTGLTQLSKARFDETGIIVTDSGAPFIPHLEEDYRISIYQNADDADANINPVFNIDNISNALTGLSNTNDNVALNAANIATNASNIQVNADAISTLVADTDASTLNGQNAAFYQNADNINAGTLDVTRLPTTGIQASTLGSALQDDSFFLNATNINSGTLNVARLPAGAAGGINAGTLDGSAKSFFQDATNLTAGTIPVARLPAGAGSGINADQLDSQEGSYYLDFANFSGVLQTSQFGTDVARRGFIIDADIAVGANIDGSKLAFGTVDKNAIGSSAVGQSELKTGSSEFSQSISGNADSVLFNMGGTISSNSGGDGSYCFYPSVRCSDNTAIYGFVGSANINSAFNNVTAYTQMYGAGATFGGSSRTLFVQVRYVQSSPPYKLGSIDFPLFVFVATDHNDDVVAVNTTQDPIWSMMLNRPVAYDENSNPLEYDDTGLDEIKKHKATNFERYAEEMSEFKRNRKLKIRSVKDKNKYMNDFQHPFLSIDNSCKVSILAADETNFEKLVDLREAGESINDLIHDGYIDLGEEIDVDDRPSHVNLRRFKFRNKK